MAPVNQPIRVLYSFPMKLGGGRVDMTAWQQVRGLVAAGADMLVFPGVVHTPLPQQARVRPTLSRGKLRISYKLVGRLRAYALHDYIVSRRLERLAGRIDIIHTWPLAALRTLKVAAKLGIPAVYERPNAHTGFFYETVQRECERLEITLPVGHEHAFNAAVLSTEYEEYQLADRLLCPSDFVAQSFLGRGFSPQKLARHQYGFDETVYYPNKESLSEKRGLSMLFVGGCAPVKGLHYALEAWLKSPAHRYGSFQIAGAFTANYAEKLAPMLNHPSIHVLGHRKDVPALMRNSDVLVLPSIAEGSALATFEARGSGCVLLVSDTTGAICTHMENALVHHAGDVETLARHITMLDENRDLLHRLRTASLRDISEVTWMTAGHRLLQVYRQVIRDRSRPQSREITSGSGVPVYSD